MAGTEMGVTEPEATFSACFGGAFLMWHPMKYAAMLAEKMEQHGTSAWLVNTGCAIPYPSRTKSRCHQAQDQHFPQSGALCPWFLMIHIVQQVRWAASVCPVHGGGENSLSNALSHLAANAPFVIDHSYSAIVPQI